MIDYKEIHPSLDKEPELHWFPQSLKNDKGKEELLLIVFSPW